MNKFFEIDKQAQNWISQIESELRDEVNKQNGQGEQTENTLIS